MIGRENYCDVGDLRFCRFPNESKSTVEMLEDAAIRFGGGMMSLVDLAKRKGELRIRIEQWND